MEIIIWGYKITGQTGINNIGDDQRQTKSKSRIQSRLCYNCRKRRHKARQCPAKQTNPTNKGPEEMDN